MWTVDPKTYAITVTRGDHAEPRFRVKDLLGAAVNCTGAACKMTVKRSLDDDISAAVFQLLTPAANGIDDAQAAVGVFDALILPAHVGALDGQYVYDFQMVLATKTRTLRRAPFFVPKQVSTPGAAPSLPSVIVPFPGGIAITPPYYVYSPNGDLLWHKFDIVIDPAGSGFYFLQDVGQNATYPF